MASGITLKSTNDSIVNIKNVGTTTGTTEVTVPNRNMTMGTEITLGTAQATTSGTYKDFTIPSGVKRVTVMFNGVSTNGTSVVQVQLGDSGGIEATGYSGSLFTDGTGNAFALLSTGIALEYVPASADIRHGIVRLIKITTNSFLFDGKMVMVSNGWHNTPCGSKTLSSELTTVRITTVNGTDTFDAGLVNVSWEY